MRFGLKTATLAAALTATMMLTGCGTISTMAKLESGAGTEASRMWVRWV